MSPSATETTSNEASEPIQVKKVLPVSSGRAQLSFEGAAVPEDEALPELRTGHKEPLKVSGALDKYEHFDVTPIIGREYVNVNLAEFLNAPNSDELLRDLAITGMLCHSHCHQESQKADNHVVSQRGVVFFRKQDDITNDLQKQLVQRLGELSGKPSTSKLHIHPVANSGRGVVNDDEISVISSVLAKKHYSEKFGTRKQSQKGQWHSDITFEPIPSDYALLRLTELPTTGGGMHPYLFPCAIVLASRIDRNVLTISPPTRHPLGIRLRGLRPHLEAPAALPRHPHGNLRPAGLQRVG